MKNSFRSAILKETGASEIQEIGKIQDLWSGYGTIKRFALKGAPIESVIVKHVCPPNTNKHPRGWNSNLSHKRKLRSYQVETAFYRNWSKLCSHRCYVPKCYALESTSNEFFIALEDLNTSGFEQRRTTASIAEIKTCLKWLAHFHSVFIGKSPEQLWETGTYWHLETRPDELNVLKDKDLKAAAKAIDESLRSSPFQTFVHGDAKLANFCFSKDGKKVAAVDFQYVGGGCGMKDVAYFVGSCLEEDDCEKYETELLDHYFDVLTNILKSKRNDIDTLSLVENWRTLYPMAWADFHRFIKGWSPDHWKINSYSERISRQVIDSLANRN